LLDEARGGRFSVAPAGGEAGVHRYLPKSNGLETTFRSDGSAFRVIDFAPRFVHYDRSFRPTQVVRILDPLEGTPRVRVTCEPRLGWSREAPHTVSGSNHLRYEGFGAQVRLTTDIPLSYLSGSPFALTERRYLSLTWGASIKEPLPAQCERFLSETVRYWQRWVKHCETPPVYQEEVIRSALALKLHCFEDTGAIIAATTTSIPEAPGSGRTWDYRYCWLRDSYYVLGALRLLGHFEEREQFVRYLINVCAESPSLELQPMYRIDARPDLPEQVLEDWPGYEGEGPVRIGNGAALHRQNDIFGEMVLALQPVFLDDRFSAERTRETMSLVERLAQKAIAVSGTEDTGIWELRTTPRPQTFSNLMCWVAADRMAKIAARHSPAREEEFKREASRIRTEILAKAWSSARGGLGAAYGTDDVDAALLQIVPLRFLPSDDPRVNGTIEAIRRELSREGWLFRYANDDGFGPPKVAFTICSFWLVEALAMVGRQTEARELLARVRGALPPLGLISEDYATSDGRMWGNFPQAYSHVGLIHAAFAASPRWSEVL
jgi:GH15 family glucan-1,4-alpha-glucosidase